MIEVSSGASKVVLNCLGQVVVRKEKICFTYILCILTLHFHIVDGVDIKALVYVFFKKTRSRERVSQINGDKHDGEFRLAWVHIRQSIL